MPSIIKLTLSSIKVATSLPVSRALPVLAEGLPSHGLPVNPATNAIPKKRFIEWRKLNEEDKAYAKNNLGYGRGNWNNPGSHEIETWAYADLYDDELAGVKGLGITEDMWDCHINHYQGYWWDELLSLEQFFVVLGWDADSWDNDAPPPEVVDVSWDNLTPEQRSALTQVCYTRDMWNGVPLGEWEATPTSNTPASSLVRQTSLPASPVTASPSRRPSFFPTRSPDWPPSAQPSPSPTESDTEPPPSKRPTRQPVTVSPTEQPTPQPLTNGPTKQPTLNPITDSPSNQPTAKPVTDSPSYQPTHKPVTDSPTNQPTQKPVTGSPSYQPTLKPVTNNPSDQPTQKPVTESPTNPPTQTPVTDNPSFPPTPKPVTDSPSDQPTQKPVTKTPTKQPTQMPLTNIPSYQPTQKPFTDSPSDQPTQKPVTDTPTKRPSSPSKQPSTKPVTDRPSNLPTQKPATGSPSEEPATVPPLQPSMALAMELSESISNDDTPTPTATIYGFHTNSATEKIPEKRFLKWSLLSDADLVHAVSNLGYDRNEWNNPGTNDVERWGYHDLYRDEIVGAQGLGIDEEMWDCHVNHYFGYHWEDIDFWGYAPFFNELGWDADNWDSSNEHPDTEAMYWDELTPEQQMAAAQLCYHEDLWNMEPIPKWDK